MADTPRLFEAEEPMPPVETEPPDVPQPTPEPQQNGLGLTAFVIGAVGLIGASVLYTILPGALLAVIGLVFGIIALRIRDRQRAFAIAGTAVSAVAVLLCTYYLVVLPITLANMEDGLPSAPVPGTGPTLSGGDGAPGSLGTRESPVPIDTTVRMDSAAGTVDWEVTLGPPLLDADDVLAAYSQSTPPPPEGLQYAMVPVTVVYVGTETGTPWADLAFDFVSAAGIRYSSTDSFAVAPQPLTDLNGLVPGAGGTGNVVVAVPSADIENGTWVVSTMLGDQYFFEAQ